MKATGMHQNYLDKLTIVREKRWEIKYLELSLSFTFVGCQLAGDPPLSVCGPTVSWPVSAAPFLWFALGTV